MAIQLNVDRVMKQRKISLTKLAARMQITLANLSIIKTNKARAVRFSTLEALCRELQCQPGDLLEYVPESLARPVDAGARPRDPSIKSPADLERFRDDD